MWVLFAPDAGTDPLWQTLEENEFFELQAYKPATSSKNETSLLSMLTALPSSLLATSRAPSLIGGGTEETFPYRILLKTQPPYGQRHAAKQQSKEAKDSGSVELSSVADSSHGGSRAPAQVIALAKDLRVIKEHWNWLVNDMSTACSFFTRESEKEENELWDFLLMKFTSMAQQEAKKREMQREREREKAMERERQLEIATFVDNKHKYAKKQANIMINEEEEEDNKAKEKRFEEMDQSRQALWKKLFPKISTIERLIVEYPCSLERKGVERRGLLLVTPRHVCFHSPRLNTRVAIYWRVITSLSRATAVNGTVPAIYVTCLGAYHEEFLFHSLADFEQTMGLLVRIWHMALLEEAADRDGDEEAKARLMGITREQLLCEIEREKHRKTFRMPKEELLIAEFCGSLWMENIIQVYEGTLHISANYVCFHADVEGHNFSVVIPFREVLDIISVDSKLIQVNTHSNKFSFSLLWRRQHCCELMVQLWSRRIRSSERLLEKVPPAEGPWDDFGFVGLGPIVKDSKHFRSDYAIKQKLQRKRWEEYIGKYGWGIQMLKTSDALRDIVRYGIPDELKGGLWQIFLGSAHSFCIKPGEYQNLLKQFDGKNSDAISEIERDVNRSFPEHPYFQSESGKQALRNVLIAYSWRNPSLGYCQSMNIICSLLLLFMGEEETFWALTILCEELFPQYFTPDMLGSMTDQHVLEDLVAEHFPKLNAHLESIQLPLVLISFPWFMCLFIGYIPMQTSIRILDILFCEGYDSTFMFKVALAVFKFNQKFILNTKDFSKLVIQLKFTNLDCDTLLEITEDFWWVTSKLINEMRDYHRFQLLKESKTPAPPIASPSGTSLSARSTSAPTHFPRAPSTPVQTPTPTPSSSPPLPTYMTMPIRTRSDSSLFATAKTPLGPMSIPEGTTGSLTTIPFLTSADMSGAGSPSSQPPMSAPSGYMVKTPSPSPTPRKVQFDGTTIPFVGGATDNKIMSALTRLSSKERLARAEEDESTSTDATGSDDDATSSMDDSSDTDSSDDDDDDTVSSETVSETERVTDPVSAGQEASDEAGQEESRSARRRKAKREEEEAEREQLFHLELDPKPTAAGATAEPDSSGTAQAADAENGQSDDGVVLAASGAKTPVDEAARLAGGSKSEPSTPIRVTHSDDVLDANDAEKEKRRKRKIKSRRRRLASLGRTRSRKSRERVGNRLKGINADDSSDVFEPVPDDDEREKRIVRLDLDLNLAWRKSTAEDRAGADGNKGVKYLQRFLFKKRRRHSDGYLDIIKEEDASLVSPRTRTGDDSGEPSVTHRRFFVEEDEGEERETTFGEPDAPDSARREKGKEKEKETVIERRRSQTDTMFSPRHRSGEHEAAPVVASSSADLKATESLSTSALSRTSEGLFASSSSSIRVSGRTQQQQQQQQRRPSQLTMHDNSGGERKDKEKDEEEQQQSEDESSSETDESERDDELKSSIFVTSNTTHLPRVRKTKKVRERRASVANLLKKEPSGRLLDHAGAFVERKRAEQLEEDFLIRTAGAAVAAAAGKRSDEMSPVHSLKAMDRVDSKPSGLALEQTHTTPLKRSKEVADHISAAAAGDLAPAVVMKATVTPGGRSPPLLPKIEELREDLNSSADEDSGSDGDLAGRELGTSPEGGRRKKIRSKLRNSRRLSLSEPNLNLATSPQSHHMQQRGRSNSKAAARQVQQAASELERSDEEEWERTSDDEVSTRHRRGAINGGVGDRSGGDSDGSDSDRESEDGDSSRSSLDYGQPSSGSSGHHLRRSEDGERPEGGSGRRRAKFFKYSADILAKTKGAGGRDKDRDRDRGERDDRKRIEEQRRRDKDRTKEEEREKRKKERMDEKEARRRSKEDKERRKVLSGGSDDHHHHHHHKEKERERERERDGLDDSDKKRRHKEEKEMKRRKEEEEKESRRKRKEEEKELKKQHKLEKRKDASSSELDERGGDGGGAGGGGSDIVGKQDKQHKKAFGLLPLPHLHHGHSLSFHLPSSPRRNTGGGSSAASNGMLKTPPSPRAHVAPITFNRTTPHPQAQEGSPRKPAPAPASTNSSRDGMTSSDDSLTQ